MSSERECYRNWRKGYLEEHPVSEAFKNSPTVSDALQAAFLAGIKHGGRLCTIRAGLVYSNRSATSELSRVLDEDGWSDAMRSLTFELGKRVWFQDVVRTENPHATCRIVYEERDERLINTDGHKPNKKEPK